MILKRILVFLGPLLIAIILELSFYNLKLLYVLPFIGILGLLLILKYLIKEKLFSQEYFYLSLLPFLLFICTISLLLLISFVFLKHLIIILFALLLILYLENIFLYYYQPLNYQLYALENLAAIFNLIIFFLLAIILNAFYTFLNLPLWLLSIILIIALSLLISQSFWINKLKNEFCYVYLLIIDIIILEFFWALTFLPTNFYVSSIILTIIFYLIWGILKAKLNEQLAKPIIWRYLLISTILLLIIIITSQWA
jgi:hypothetical protein